jgi:NADP-reducing hydrogenase subunit HndC
MPKLSSFYDLKKLRDELAARRDPSKLCVAVCSDTGCVAYQSRKIAATFEAELQKQGLSDKVELRRTGCLSFCERGPVVFVFPQNLFYQRVKIEDVAEIVSETLGRGKVLDRLLYEDEATGEKIPNIDDIPYYKYQNPVLIGQNRWIDTSSIDDYIAGGGYSALAKILSGMKPEDVLEEVKKANLRGRGGGGFPAGRKWQTSRDAQDDIKYVIVNADEGDPGAFMDESLLMGNPHSVIEGLIIGGFAIGSHQGFIYLRQEYQLAGESTVKALEKVREYGLIGKNILGSGFDFDIALHRGAGAFVSGESSALMTAIEGKVGEPRPKYIRTAVKGVWDHPSILNNVETWANVPLIINKGADWFCTLGTEKSKGTKIFSLVGKVKNTGLVEVPMGITLRDIIFKVGGGIPKNKKFKAVQTGGPSGGCLPESLIDLPVDFDELTKAGSMMGSGGIIVMDEDICMVDVARYFMEFLANESCGKCVPCREGLRNTCRILNDIVSGRGKEEDLVMLQEIADVMSEASLCALGKTAANPLLTAIKYFREEYEVHIREKRCPAKVCRELINYYIDPAKCKACGLCIKACPTGAITGKKKTPHVIEQSKCVKCGGCFTACPEKFGAVTKISGGPVPGTAAAKS